MATMTENVIAACAENQTPMLEKGMYDSWKTCIWLYIKGKENGEMLLDSITKGPFQLKEEINVPSADDTIEENRAQTVEDLSPKEKLRYDSDIKAVNILLLRLPVDIYTLINHYQTTKEIWDWVKELMEGTEMTLRDCEPKLSDEFDRFTSEPGESIHSHYLRFSKLINDMNIIKMSMLKMQINTKGEGHMAKQYQQDFLADRLEEIDKCEDLQLQTTLNFKTGHVDAYDLDCDDEATASAIFMASLSPARSLNDDTVAPTYNSDILSRVPHYDMYHENDVLNYVVQEAEYIEHFVSNNYSYDALTSDNNVISYADYMVTIENDVAQYVPYSSHDNAMILSVIE
ncbi:hypothetical protein Tco_0427467 [Tanacetum coccineum]